MGLTERRDKLPPAAALWAGGHAPVLRRRAMQGVLVLPSLRDVGGALAKWREGLAAAP